MATTESLPGVTTKEVSPGVRTMKGVKPLTGYLVGKFADVAAGLVNVPALYSGSDLGTLLGGLKPGSAVKDAEDFLAQGNRMLYVVPIEGTKAFVTIVDRTPVTPVDKLTLTARVSGTWANGTEDVAGIVATVADDTPTGTFKLTIVWVYTEGASVASYTEVLRQLTLDPTSARYFETYINEHSKLVTCEDLAPASITWPTHAPAVDDYVLAAGVEPDYDDGIDVMGQVAGRLVAFTDTDDTDVNDALIAAVIARSGTAEDRKAGGSICVLNNPQYTSVAALETAGGNIAADSRVKLMGTWKRTRDSAINATRSVRPGPFYAGVRCAIPYYKSATNKKVNGITGAERALSEADLTALFQAGITELAKPMYDENAGYVVLTDQSTDGSETFVRVIKDFEVAMGLANLGWAVGENQGEADPDPTRVAVTGQFATTYEAMKANGIIERYSVQCDADNNPVADIEAKKLKLHREVKYRNVINQITDELVAGPESVIAREL